MGYLRNMQPLFKLRPVAIWVACVVFLLLAEVPGAVAQVRDGEWSLCTFNIRYDNPTDPLKWEERKDEVAQIIGFYDIVGLQEVLPHQWTDLEERLPWMSCVGRGREADGSGEACPIFFHHAKWELLHHETIWLAPEWKTPGATGWTADLPRTATIAWFHHLESGRRVKVYNTHWSHVSPEAREASGRLIATIDALHGVEATVVLGDFNEEDGGKGRAALSSAGFQNTYDSIGARCRKSFPTYTTFQPTGASGGPRIDAIYVKGLDTKWTCVDEIIKKEHFISDHLPLHAVVSWASSRE